MTVPPWIFDEEAPLEAPSCYHLMWKNRNCACILSKNYSKAANEQTKQAEQEREKHPDCAKGNDEREQRKQTQIEQL